MQEPSKALSEKQAIIEPKIIESDDEYAAFRVSLELSLRGPLEPGSALHDRVSLIKKLLEDYERKRMTIACADPVDAIRYRMQELGMRQRDLASLLGGKNRASEILARKRTLTLAMIRALVRQLDIPAEMLIDENRRLGDADKGSFADGVFTPPLTKGAKPPFGNPEIGTPQQAAGNLKIKAPVAQDSARKV